MNEFELNYEPDDTLEEFLSDDDAVSRLLSDIGREDFTLHDITSFANEFMVMGMSPDEANAGLDRLERTFGE